MKGNVKLSKDKVDLKVNISMSYSEFQDLGSFMNVVSLSERWEIYNKAFDHIPEKFNELLHSL